jgi:hypothetical protein
MKVTAWLLAGALALAPITVANAQGRDPARADTLFREGRESMRRGDLEAACARFGESQLLDPAPGTLLNLADCEERLGRLTSAYRHVQGALADLPARDDRARIARERLVVIERRLAHVVVRLAAGTASDARVLRDGAAMPPAELGADTPLDPGPHAFVLSAAGRERRVEVTLREGERREIVLELAPAPPPSAPAVVAAPPPPPAASSAPFAANPPPPSTPTRTAGYVAAGVGIGGLVIAGVTGVVLAGKKSVVSRDCDGAARTCTTQEGVDAASSGKPLVPLFYGATVVGLVGVGVATVLLWPSGPRATAVIAPGRVGLEGAF